MNVVSIINNTAAGKTIKIPAGTYIVEPKIKPRTGVTVDLTGVTLKIPAQTTEYHFLLIDQPNITIKGGTLIGDRDTSKRSTTAQNGGYGIRIRGSASNITINGTACNKMWADGFIIHSSGKGFKLTNVTGDANRRQGLSICDGQDIVVADSTFKNTSPLPPAAGIDIEPWEKSQLVKGVLITNCQILNNKGHGITINQRLGPVRDVTIEKCTYKGNGMRPLNNWGWSKWQDLLASIGLYKPTSIKID